MTTLTTQERLDAMAAKAKPARDQALAELAAGQKRGHWIWWVFPTLAVRGGDMNSALQLRGGGADLISVAEARAYVQHPALRSGLLESMRTAHSAFAKHEEQGPYKVLDAGFGRAADGQWVGGPVDSFKVWCSSTMFAVLAHEVKDAELQEAALAVVRSFKGDITYTPAGEGTAGHSNAPAEKLAELGIMVAQPAGSTEQPIKLGPGPDLVTIQLLGGSSSEVF